MFNTIRLFCVGVLLLACARASSGQTIYCPSDDGNRHRCDADTRGGVQLTNQHSGSPCTQGYSWGYDARGIWVDHGCRADFALGAVPPPDEYDRVITCSSDDGGRNFCPFNTRRGVRLVNQRSGSPCKQGYSWDFDERGVWVDHGCRADFAAEGRERRERDEGGISGQTVTCSSDDGRQRYCEMDLRGARVQLVKQRSEARCEQGVTWGYDGRGIWVDRGCRADFLVETRGDAEGPGSRRRSCERSVGEARANELANQCQKVTPGERAACDPHNTCKAITDQIRRGCELLGWDAPGFCDEYR